MPQDDKPQMSDEELAAQLRFAAEQAGPLLRGLGAAAALLARMVGDGLLPVLAAAAASLAALKESCPAAFDETGKLRPDWREIVQRETGVALNLPPRDRATRRQKTPKIHVGLATRQVKIYRN